MSNAPVLRVAINAPLSRLFDYLPGDGALPAVGARVRVPFGHRRQVGLVMEIAAESELPRGKLRRVGETLDDEPLLGDDELWLIRFTSDYYHHPVGEVVAAALPAVLRQGKPLNVPRRLLATTDAGRSADLDVLGKRAPKQAALLTLVRDSDAIQYNELDEAMPGWRRTAKPLADKGLVEEVEAGAEEHLERLANAEQVDGPTLNPDQAAALECLRDGEGFRVSLLDGVTGSGKTEVYLQLIRDAIDAGKQALVLVPEIGLTPQLVARFRTRLGVEPVILHSALTDNARLDAWRAARNGSAPLVVGTRSAIFVPLANPGLLVVDEEHDASLKQQEGLRYSARDLAVARGKRQDVPVILGTATPSLESLNRCAEGAYRHLRLPQRAGGASPPSLRLVDMSRHDAADGLSAPAIAAIADSLGQDGQVLVFLNRRGYAPTLICSACGSMAECTRCDARMTVHARRNRLLCHHCGASRPVEETCGDCGEAVRPLGQGTERLEEALTANFPGQRIMRVDSDTTRGRHAMQAALDAAASGEAEILVGTQMLSKGHHFPNLNLVVVVNADQGLFSTDFRGAERLAQGLVQVAGRAGRESLPGKVMIQTAYPQHAFWSALLDGGYDRVAAAALAEREAAAWPPFSHLALLRASAADRAEPREFLDGARGIAESMRQDAVRILGPVSAPMERKAGRYRAQLLLQSRQRRPLHDLLRRLRAELEHNARTRRVRWSIDVDPIELF